MKNCRCLALIEIVGMICLMNLFFIIGDVAAKGPVLFEGIEFGTELDKIISGRKDANICTPQNVDQPIVNIDGKREMFGVKWDVTLHFINYKFVGVKMCAEASMEKFTKAREGLLKDYINVMETGNNGMSLDLIELAQTETDMKKYKKTVNDFEFKALESDRLELIYLEKNGIPEEASNAKHLKHLFAYIDKDIVRAGLGICTEDGMNSLRLNFYPPMLRGKLRQTAKEAKIEKAKAGSLQKVVFDKDTGMTSVTGKVGAELKRGKTFFRMGKYFIGTMFKINMGRKDCLEIARKLSESAFQGKVITITGFVDKDNVFAKDKPVTASFTSEEIE